MQRWKKALLLSLMIAVIALFTACSNDENTDGSTEDKEESKGNAKEETKSDGFKEVEEIDVEGYASKISLFLDHDGSTMAWAEADGKWDNDARVKVKVDDEISEVETDLEGTFNMLTHNGKIVYSETDPDQSKKNRQTLVLYDPKSGEKDTYKKEDDQGEVVVTQRKSFIEDLGVFTAGREYKDGVQAYIWNFKEDTYVEADMTEVIYGVLGEVETGVHPRYTISSDAKTLYVGIENNIFRYDVDTEETDAILLEEDIEDLQADAWLTNDDKYLIYMSYDTTSDDAPSPEYYAFNTETDESKPIGSGNGNDMFSLDDGNIVFVDGSDIHLYDFSAEEDSIIHTIELEENEDLGRIAVSEDGNTIAYAYTIEGENKADNEDKIRMLRK